MVTQIVQMDPILIFSRDWTDLSGIWVDKYGWYVRITRSISAYIGTPIC